MPLDKNKHGEDGWLIEKQAKLIFKIEDRAKAPTGCPQGEILYTEYSELYLTEVDGYEHTQEVVDFSLYARQLADYILYETERMSMTTSATISRNLCQEQYRDTKMEIIKVDEDKFGRRAGEVLYTFTCTRRPAHSNQKENAMTGYQFQLRKQKKCMSTLSP